MYCTIKNNTMMSALSHNILTIFVNIRLKLKILYMFAAGFYTYSIFALIFWETRRSDFGVSMGHHVATDILIVLSYIFRYVVMEYVLS